MNIENLTCAALNGVLKNTLYNVKWIRRQVKRAARSGYMSLRITPSALEEQGPYILEPLVEYLRNEGLVVSIVYFGDELSYLELEWYTEGGKNKWAKRAKRHLKSSADSIPMN